MTGKAPPENIFILRTDAMMGGKYTNVGGLETVWFGDDGVEYIRKDLVSKKVADGVRAFAATLRNEWLKRGIGRMNVMLIKASDGEKKDG